MAERVLAHDKIKVQWNSVLEEILAGEDEKFEQLELENLDGKEPFDLDCKGVFIAIGHTPNTKPFEGILDLDENGYLLPSEEVWVKTSIPGIYVAGDCADHVYRQAITAAGMGCQAAIEAERWLAEQS